MEPDNLPAQKSPWAHRLLSFAGLHFHGLGCGKFPVSVWLGAQGTRMQFTSFLGRCTQVGQGTEGICFRVSALGFHRDIMQRSPAGKVLNTAHFQHISQGRASFGPPAVFINSEQNWVNDHSDKIRMSIGPGPEKTVMAPTLPAKKKPDFDPRKFLATIGEGRKVVHFSQKQTVFTQGDAADAVFYIQEGKVRLTVVSQIGKEATLGVLSEGEFFGEGALAGQPLRMGSAAAMTDCELLQIDKKAMMLALHREHAFSDLFVAYLLARNIRYEEDLVDQLFNSSEKRLARILLLLAHFGKEGVPETVIPKISQEMLAEMIGTTRSRVSFFMNRFRKLGFVDYGGSGMQVHSSLLNVVLHD
jgi:CRP/FNR family transcriptional regulator, cyclic AMP receptor protein